MPEAHTSEAAWSTPLSEDAQAERKPYRTRAPHRRGMMHKTGQERKK